jgi:phosphatidate cytidylyltransferase
MSGLLPCHNFMNHHRRILSAVIILPPVILFLLFASHELFAFLACIVTFLSLQEYYGLLMMKQASVRTWLGHALALALAGAAYLRGPALMAPVLTFGMILLTALVMWQAEGDTPPFLALMGHLFGILLIGWGLSHLVVLHGLEQGSMRTLLLCAVLWSGDIAAMYVGRYFGRRPMVPTISPGKTWEGALGSILGCLVVATLGAWLLSLSLTIYQSLVFGLLISCTAQIGDLAESLFKRYIGVKDSGTLIPGHGGVLDRVDSFLFAAPPAAYFFISLDALTLR